jgi:hypothetical protein
MKLSKTESMVVECFIGNGASMPELKRIVNKFKLERTASNATI